MRGVFLLFFWLLNFWVGGGLFGFGGGVFVCFVMLGLGD